MPIRHNIGAAWGPLCGFDSFRGKKWTTVSRCWPHFAVFSSHSVKFNVLCASCLVLSQACHEQVMSVFVSSLKVSGQVVCQFVTMLALLGAALRLFHPIFLIFGTFC